MAAGMRRGGNKKWIKENKKNECNAQHNTNATHNVTHTKCEINASVTNFAALSFDLFYSVILIFKLCNTVSFLYDNIYESQIDRRKCFQFFLNIWRIWIGFRCSHRVFPITEFWITVYCILLHLSMHLIYTYWKRFLILFFVKSPLSQCI
jgi:hypothetical protein